MKAEMNEEGMITIIPETTVEAYALRQWAIKAALPIDDIERDENMHWRGSMLMIIGNIPFEELSK